MDMSSRHKTSKETPVLAELYFNRCPYEHLVVPYEALHPKLQMHLAAIGKQRVLARCGMMIDSIYLGLHLVGAAESIDKGFIACNAGLGAAFNAAVDRTTEDLNVHKNVFRLANLGSCVPAFRYTMPALLGKLIGALIKQIIEKNEAPYEGCLDPRMVLEDYHYGVIDNRLSLVLFKHPHAKNSSELKGFARYLRNFQLNQPFQRTKFTLSNPELRQKKRILGNSIVEAPL